MMVDFYLMLWMGARKKGVFFFKKKKKAQSTCKQKITTLLIIRGFHFCGFLGTAP